MFWGIPGPGVIESLASIAIRPDGAQLPLLFAGVKYLLRLTSLN